EPKIAVEAVEIDGSKIFVAGTADPGRKVRAYADAILLGDAKTSAASLTRYRRGATSFAANRDLRRPLRAVASDLRMAAPKPIPRFGGMR
ncbi:hypothetical protein EN815_34255, partial [Mesorhizobium sp. M4B.F.Ca.ET.172.01.1.1]